MLEPRVGQYEVYALVLLMNNALTGTSKARGLSPKVIYILWTDACFMAPSKPIKHLINCSRYSRCHWSGHSTWLTYLTQCNTIILPLLTCNCSAYCLTDITLTKVNLQGDAFNNNIWIKKYFAGVYVVTSHSNFILQQFCVVVTVQWKRKH